MTKGEKLDLLKVEYTKQLALAVVKHPDDYPWACGSKLTVQDVSYRMMAAIATKGMGGVTINSHAWKATAKHFGIKNTYKAWAAWFLDSTQS